MLGRKKVINKNKKGRLQAKGRKHTNGLQNKNKKKNETEATFRRMTSVEKSIMKWKREKIR